MISTNTQVAIHWLQVLLCCTYSIYNLPAIVLHLTGLPYMWNENLGMPYSYITLANTHAVIITRQLAT